MTISEYRLRKKKIQQMYKQDKIHWFAKQGRQYGIQASEGLGSEVSYAKKKISQL